VWKGVGAYVAWGLFPFYWKQVDQVPAQQIIGHRIFWSFVTLAVIVLGMGQGRRLGAAAKSTRVLLIYGGAAVLISANWFVYIWAVNGGFIVETSLGYFINPLVSVVLGVVVFGERLRVFQWIAVALAASGVTYLTIAYGTIPWIALTLALTFAVYSVIKRVAPLGSLDGLTIETAIIALPALAYLVYADRGGGGAFFHAGLPTTLFLAGAGMVTTLPLVLFASAVREVPLTLIGILQYISPTLQLAAGVLFYHEPFAREQLLGFSGVWAGLAIFGFDGWMARRR
jgi:chloramphenicol-sensitive protein RarD